MGEVATGRFELYEQARHDYHRAWWSLLLFVVSGAAAIATGEGLAAAYGYASYEQDQAPGWLALAVGYPAFLVFTIPALITTHYARRARRVGINAALVPLIVAWGLPAVFLLQNLLTYWSG